MPVGAALAHPCVGWETAVMASWLILDKHSQIAQSIIRTNFVYDLELNSHLNKELFS